MDAFQTITAIAIFISVSFFVFLSVQIFFVLRELREALKKMSSIMENVEEATSGVKKTIGSLGSFLKIIEFIKNRFNR